MKNRNVIVSEYVGYEHSDKFAEQISDALLDKYIEIDSNAKVSINTVIQGNTVILTGNVITDTHIDVENVIRDLFEYTTSDGKGDDINIINLIRYNADSNINDHGLCIGYACHETIGYTPIGSYLARSICNGIGRIVGILPDAKVQVGVDYSGRRPKVVNISISANHIELWDTRTAVDEITQMIMDNQDSDGLSIMDGTVFVEYIKDKDFDLIINTKEKGTSKLPNLKQGVSGRNSLTNEYGGLCYVPGTSPSGKDFTHIERAGNYMCRYLAKNIVDTGMASNAKVELCYLSGNSLPSRFKVTLETKTTMDTNVLENYVESYIQTNFDLSIEGINCLFFPNGVESIFYNTARNGHFGVNDVEGWYLWERLDFSDKLKEFIREKQLMP